MTQKSINGAWSTAKQMFIGAPPSDALVLQVDFNERNELIDPRLASLRNNSASIYTVTFSVDTRPGIFAHVNPIGEVRFSTNGNTVQRAFNVVNGTSISGVCDHITVKVLDGGRLGVIPPLSDTRYDVSVLVAPMPRPTSQSPFFRPGSGIPVAVPGGGISTISVVPQNIGANSVSVFAGITVAGDTINNILVAQLNEGGIVLGTYMVSAAAPFVPLLPWAETIRITNFNANPITALAIYGIDG